MSKFVSALRRHLTRSRLRTLCLVVGLAVLLSMVIASDPAVLWANILRMRWSLAAIVGVWGMGYLFNTVSWSAIIRQNVLMMPLRFSTLFRFTVTGFSINYITPFGLLGGEPYRVMELKPYLGLERASASVILYMMMHICSHFLFWIVSCALVVLLAEVRSLFLSVLLLTIVAVCAVLIFFFFKGYRAGMIVRLVGGLSHWPLIGRRLRVLSADSRARLRQVDDNISSLLIEHPRAFWTSLLVEFLSRMVNCWEIYLIMFVLGCPISYGASVIVVALSSLFANVLFFSPLQLGTREGGILLALQVVLTAMPMAAMMPLAISVSIMTRIREFFWIIVGLLFLKFRAPRVVAASSASDTLV